MKSRVVGKIDPIAMNEKPNKDLVKPNPISNHSELRVKSPLKVSMKDFFPKEFVSLHKK
jgi:hypothetical protein